MFGAKTFGGSRETSRSLAQNFTNNQDASDAIAGFECGDFLAHEGIFVVGQFEGHFIERVIRNEPINAASLVFELTHCLLESPAERADEV